MRKRPLAVVAVSALVVLGCSAPPASPGLSASARPSDRPATAAPSTTAEGDLAGRDAALVVGRSGDQMLDVIIASTGERVLQLPAGAPASPDWRSIAVATHANGETTVARVVPEAGPDGPGATLDGEWRLPTVGYDPTPVGLSDDLSTLVLVPDEVIGSAGAADASRFAILDFEDLAKPARMLELDGSFEFDALSPDGAILYVVEHLTEIPGGAYQVRAIDLPSGAMRPGIIVDKRNIGETMAGWPVAQLRSPDGFVLSLYRGPEHPFIHALDTIRGWAVCIDLPAGSHDVDAALDWGMAATEDWSAVYAVNGTLGSGQAIRPDAYDLRDIVTTSDAGEQVVELAKFGHEASGGVARRVLASPDDSKVFAAGADGIAVIDPRALAVVSRLLPGVAIDGLALTRDGRTLFALLHDGGRIVTFDTATGERLGDVPGEGYDRVVAVMPW